MRFSNTYSNKSFKIGLLAGTFKNIFQMFESNFEDYTISLSSKNREIESSKTLNFDDLYTITELNDNNYSIDCSPNFKLSREEKFRSIHIQNCGNVIGILIESEKAEIIHSIIEVLTEQLELVEDIPKMEESIESRIEKLENKINSLEEKLSNKTLSCFISMRFDEKSKKYLQLLEKFLTLLNINVVTGLSYEPRKVSEKVISRLDKNIDFVLYLITNENESFWTRDELVYGSQKGCFTIPLVEKGAKFNSGIFGDL
ncbi:MAG TPA: hypothetical protein PKE03_09555 [Bacteroidales bacterium]|nr:hypothetical protein [Bacteroidales bacterium]